MDGNTHNGKYKRSGYKSMYRISILRYKMTICLYKIQFTVSSEWLCACIVCVCVSYHKVSILRFQQASLMAFSIDIYIYSFLSFPLSHSGFACCYFFVYSVLHYRIMCRLSSTVADLCMQCTFVCTELCADCAAREYKIAIFWKFFPLSMYLSSYFHSQMMPKFSAMCSVHGNIIGN